MEQLIMDTIGQLGLIAIICGLAASAITNQTKTQLGLTGWRVLAAQEVLSVVIAALILVITAQGTPTDSWTWLQYLAAGLLGGLIVATGWDFAGRLGISVLDEPETTTTDAETIATK